ncbi:hypothetical protein [Paenibacillus rhizovicinus]|uniref:hypothetical protein n=1 Tax=Paenibacillus rhizovicinus TaxID=2704463 RepID=UPI001CDD2D51|nr:hypothetical protein [Paenibacillus rhizovicinus]
MSGKWVKCHVLRVHQDPKDPKDPKDPRGHKGRKGLRGPWDLKGFKDLKDPRDLKDLKDLKDPKDLKGHKDLKDFRVYKEHKDHREYKDLKGFKVLQGQPARKDLKGPQARLLRLTMDSFISPQRSLFPWRQTLRSIAMAYFLEESAIRSGMPGLSLAMPVTIRSYFP